MIIADLPTLLRLFGTLKACAKPMYDQLNSMTVQESKKHSVDSPKAYVRVSVTRYGNGNIKKLSGRL